MNRRGAVLVSGSARQFFTSEVTIRQDLQALQNESDLHRTHGGALPARSAALFSARS